MNENLLPQKGILNPYFLEGEGGGGLRWSNILDMYQNMFEYLCIFSGTSLYEWI